MMMMMSLLVIPSVAFRVSVLYRGTYLTSQYSKFSSSFTFLWLMTNIPFMVLKAPLDCFLYSFLNVYHPAANDNEELKDR